MKKLKQLDCHIEHIVLPILTLLCLAGFIGSLLFPKKVLDTYQINVTEEEGDAEFAIPLSDREMLSYSLNTAGNPMRGIQVAVSKGGSGEDEILLHYQVYERSTDEEQLFGELLSDNVYPLSECADMQYVYLPFADSENCMGDIIIRFFYEGAAADGNPPALLANHTLIDHTMTMQGTKTLDGSLKTMYVYTHDTFPLLYDFRLMTFVLLAVSMAVSYPVRKRGKRDAREA